MIRDLFLPLKSMWVTIAMWCLCGNLVLLLVFYGRTTRVLDKRQDIYRHETRDDIDKERMNCTYDSVIGVVHLD